MKYLLLMLVFVCAQSMADQIMTNMSLSFTPAVNETTCEFSAYDQYNTFRYSKTGNVRDVGGCVVSYTQASFSEVFQYCSQQPKAPYNTFQEQHCQIWTQGTEVHFYIPTKSKSMCLFTCLTAK